MLSYAEGPLAFPSRPLPLFESKSGAKLKMAQRGHFCFAGRLVRSWNLSQSKWLVLKSHIQRILKGVFYTGIMERDGKYYQGKHEPLISKQLFDDAQRVMSGNSRPRPNRLFFPLRGFLNCASCGCSLTASLHKGHQYYYCTNGKGSCVQHKVYLREEDAYKLVANLFDDLIFSDRKIELMYRAAKAVAEKNGGEQVATLYQLNKNIASLLEKESKLLDAFLGEQISKELYERKVSEIQFDRIALNKQIVEAEKGRGVSTLEPTKKLFKQANTAKKIVLLQVMQKSA